MHQLKNNISFITALLFALAFSYVFYNFMLTCSEAARLMSVSSQHQIWTFDPADAFWFRLFCALISLIFGQSVFLRFWFFRLRKPGEKRYFRNTSIQLDQTALNAYFFHWFSRMTMIYASVYGMCYLYISGNPGFIAEFRWLFVLTPIVLFLQNWTTIRRSYGKHSLQWMLVSAVVIFISSFAFSQISLVKSELHTQLVLSKNPDYLFNIEYPETDTSDGYIPPSMITDLYLLVSEQDSVPWIYANDSLYRYQDLHLIVRKAFENKNDYYFNEPVFRLHIDRHTKMKWVYRLKDDLSCMNITRIGFVVSNPFTENIDRNMIRMRIYPQRCDEMLFLFSSPDTTKFSSLIHVSYDENNNQTLIDANEISEDSLKCIFYRKIETDSNFLILINRNDNQPFGSYLNVFVQLRKAVYQLRNEESIRCFNMKSDELQEREFGIIQRKYSLRWVEIP